VTVHGPVYCGVHAMVSDVVSRVPLSPQAPEMSQEYPFNSRPSSPAPGLTPVVMGKRVPPSETTVSRGAAGPVAVAGVSRSTTAWAEGSDSAPRLSTETT